MSIAEAQRDMRFAYFNGAAGAVRSATLYGMRIYWAFGATLALAAVALLMMEAPVVSGAYTGALIEYVFGIALFRVKLGMTEQEASPVA